MRRPLAVSLALLLTVGVSQSRASVSPVVPSVPGTVQTSANVKHVGTIPLDGAGVSMQLVRVGKQLRAFVSGAAGLSIYDATDPLKPSLLGHLPIYNWENEAIAVSPDGRTAFLTEFEGTLYLHVVDVSNPLLPRIVGSLVPGGAHTVECADPRCDYLFGSEGQTYDVRDRAHPKELPAAQSWGSLLGAGHSGHNLHKDASGLWISDTSPLIAFRLNPDPLHLKKVTTGDITLSTQYQHNNIRPRAERFKTRTTTSGPLRDGELLLGEGETNFAPECDGTNGAFSTWSMVGFDHGRKMKQIDTLRPVSGTVPGFLAGANPAVNVMGCSGHWFTQKDGKDGSILVAAAWYEHGTRFLSVNPRTGKIKQVGYFQPNRGATSAAYWIPGTDVVWSVDYHSGIGIMQFDQDPKKVPTTAKTDASWLSRLDTDPFAEAVRRLCVAGADATAQQHARLHEVAP
jgi:hypothetical protein